ncbi:MAG: DUF1987 domain-containing protein [bacterium]|nr:DUF1987 domain-containing protein [bacterium]
MSNYKEGNLEILLAEEGAKNILTWTGKSDDRDPSALLNPYFDGLMDKLKGKALDIEFAKLEYMNSSSVPPIIQLIKKLNTNAIKTVISYDKESKWQSASFKALETIVRAMENVEVVGK